MLIISLQFLLFVSCVLLLYYICPLKIRPYWLLISSLFFYASFSVSDMFYLGITIVTTFVVSHWATRAFLQNKKKLQKALTFSVIILNAGILLTVKFLGYSVSLLGLLLNISVPDLTIPSALGISFYTMQSIGYSVDVYKGKYPPEKNIFKFILYMLYFPIIMQGPISRYDQLADQLFTPHRFSFNRLKSGLSLVLWGLFQKMVIADRAAILVNQVFNNYESYAGFQIIIAVLLYTIQLYADFSGFVDISRGLSESLGIELVTNFNAPYFADSIKDFWRRWHISLSSWFRDYIYIPLGGSRNGVVKKYINLMIVFLVSGLWHGVGLNYIVWGFMQGAFQIIEELISGIKNKAYRKFDVNTNTFSFKLGKRLITFSLVNLSWLIFRANSLHDGLNMLKSAFSIWNPWIFTDGSFLQLGLDGKDWNVLISSVVVLFVVNYLQTRFSVREELEKQTTWFRYAIYIGSILAILIFGIYGPGYNQAQFLYMQF